MSKDKTCVAADFDYNKEESYFTHTPSDFRLDCDFVSLFDYETIQRLFAVSSGDYILDNETVDALRDQVREHRGDQTN